MDYLIYLLAAVFLLCGLAIIMSALRRAKRRKITQRAQSVVNDAPWFIAISIALLLPLSGYAESPIIKVALTVVPGQNGLTRNEAREAFRHTRLIYDHDVGVNLVLVSTKVARAPRAVALLPSTYDDSTSQLYYWSKRFNKPGRARGVLQVAILPPIPNDGVWYFSGRAGGFCSLYTGFAYMTAPAIRSNGQSGIHNAAYTLAHELGHVLGAPHIDTETIMNPYPFPYVDTQGDIPFDIESVAAIHRCLEDWGKL